MFPIRWNFPFRKKDGSLSTIGDEIEEGGGSYTLPTASANTKGGVKIGSGLSMDGEVLNNSNPTPYSLPAASAEVLGGVKVGSGLSITDGVLSASGGGGGTQLYYKDFNDATITGGWSQYGETGLYHGQIHDIGVSGYTPTSVTAVDKYSGYNPSATLFKNGTDPGTWRIYLQATKNNAASSFNVRVYYIKDEDLTPIPSNNKALKNKK